VALALALLLHGTGWWLLRAPPGQAPRERPAPQQRPLMLRLLWPPPAPARPAPLPPVRRTTERASPRPAPQAITSPAETETPTSPSPIAQDTGPAPQPEPRPLVLTLPPEAASAPRSTRESALNDPRSNTGRLSYSERFAATLGTDRTERVTPLNGGRRIRRGTSCIEVMDSRASQIDPYGPKWPGGVRSCD
jgi:hypothetical protein